MSQLIIVIIAVIVSIISSIVKAKQRKAEEQSRRLSGQGNTSHSDPWDELLKQTESYEESVVEKSTRESHNAIERLKTERITNNITQNKFDPTSMSKDINRKIRSYSSDPIVSESIEAEIIQKEFNLRDAVIYSEILKPKF